MKLFDTFCAMISTAGPTASTPSSASTPRKSSQVSGPSPADIALNHSGPWLRSKIWGREAFRHSRWSDRLRAGGLARRRLGLPASQRRRNRANSSESGQGFSPAVACHRSTPKAEVLSQTRIHSAPPRRARSRAHTRATAAADLRPGCPGHGRGVDTLIPASAHPGGWTRDNSLVLIAEDRTMSFNSRCASRARRGASGSLVGEEGSFARR